MTLVPGLTNQIIITVSEQETARAAGGEHLPPVFSTPRLVSYLEKTAHESIFPLLDEGKTSVGTIVNIRHLAATPVGMQIRFQSELIAINGQRLTFKVEAWDEVEQIADGEHERFIIDQTRFQRRLNEKLTLINR
ncbi:MAG: thioesterase family protein [Bellilinea sp.]